MNDTRHVTIFVVTPVFAPEVGGIETHLMDLAKVMTRRGGFRAIVATFQPIFTLRRNDSPSLEQVGCFEVHRFKWVFPGLFEKICYYSTLLAELYTAPYFLLRTLALFLRRRRDVDVIHAHGLMAALVGRILRLVSGKPLVVSNHAIYHLDKPSVTNRVMRWVFKGVSRVLCTSEFSRTDIMATGFPADAIRVYRFWIDADRFQPIPRAEARRKLGWPDGFIVLYSGRFLEVKGMKLILAMAGTLPPDMNLILVGAGHMEAEVVEAIRGIPNVRRLPPQTQADMPFVYAAADVMIVPSLWQEAFARVVPEAMLCGTPVIISKRGGMQELVPEGAGVFIEPTGPDVLLEAIRCLQDAPDRREAIARAALAHARAAFGERNADVILDTYTELSRPAG